MKEKHGYLKSSLWYKEKINDPFYVISDAFDFASIKYYRNMLQDLLMCVYSKDVYHQEEAGSLLFSFEKLESIINAAWIIVEEKRVSKFDIDDDNNLLDKQKYCGGHLSSAEWDDFPRFLSRTEYCRPFIAFKTFFDYQHIAKWKEDLNSILKNSLISYEGEKELNLLAIFIHLSKLVEAAHIILVRQGITTSIVKERT